MEIKSFFDAQKGKKRGAMITGDAESWGFIGQDND